ncbi:restriction endonuclease subunit S [Streptomyces sp. NPDC048416]|uniref:restriction endonuclease subunit S n=1 Tax=Streptomyces sp. NPDC048416 TaxID=3365546 RepID=UPI00371C8770
MRRKVSQSADIVLTTKGTVGRVAMIPDVSPEFVYSPQVCFFRTLDEKVITAKYLYYWLRSDDFRHQSAGMKGQTDMADYLNLTDIGSLRVSAPPMDDQRGITEVLGALDAKISANEHMLDTLNELCSAWYERVINSTNIGTSRRTLAQLVDGGFMDLGDGYRTKQSEHGKPGIPILRVADVGRGIITPSYTHFVSNSYRSSMGPKVSQRGDVILTTKGTVGRVALIEASHPEFVYSPQVCYFRLANESPVSPFYLLHWFQGKEFWSQAGGLKGQTDMADYLSLRDIRSLQITIPSAPDLAEFDRICNPMQEQSEAGRRENDTLAALRDTLLPQLITGKIRVKEAERFVEDVA